MPLAVVFQAPDTYFVLATGEVTYPDAERAIDEILRHPCFGSAGKVLVDSTSMTAAPSAAELRRIAGDLTPLIQRGFGPVAIVSAGFGYGVARMFSVFAEVFGLTVRAFRDVDEAERWLRDALRTTEKGERSE